MSIKKTWWEALGLRAIEYPVPKYANTFWYSLGGLTLTCLAVSLLTGAVLTQFYNPTPLGAHASVNYIAETAGLGWVRAVHHWSANIGFFLLIVHMVRILYTGAFRPPRVATYVVGLLLLFVVFQLFFTGTVIKWDQEGYEALGHFLAVVNKLLGPFGAVFQEDFTLSTSMLARIYALHVGVFPSLLVLLIFFHLLYVKHFGIAPKPYQSEEDYQASLAQGARFTHHLRLLVILGSILIVVLVILALAFPPGLGEAPKAGMEVTKPPWVFWILYPIESLIGISGILLGTAVLAFGLILIPVLGITIRDEKKLFPLVRVLVVIGLIIWIAMMAITYYLPTMQHLTMK